MKVIGKMISNLATVLLLRYLGVLIILGQGRYEGDFQKGKREGKGKMEYEGREENEQGDIYNGEWKNDKMTGKGKEYYI